MAKAKTLKCEVVLWGRRVGALMEGPSGLPIFEYFDEFRSSDLKISPFQLPLDKQHGVCSYCDPQYEH